MWSKRSKQLNSVPLSARIVKERISILAENANEQVIVALKQAKCFAIQLDGTTDFEVELLFCSHLELRFLYL